MSEKNKTINPAIRATTIGVRKLREISIYPLSVGEQLKLGDVITEVVTKFVAGMEKKQGSGASVASMENVALVEFIIDLIQTNIKKVISIATDEDADKTLDDMTNEQLVDFATIIYEMNYGGDIRKKVVALIQKTQGQIRKAVKKAPKKQKL